MAPHRHSLGHPLRGVLLLTATTLFIFTAAAQGPSSPTPGNGGINPLGQTVDAASVFDDRLQQFYVIGGRSGGGNACLPDTLVVDLRTPWTVDRPTYRMLAAGQPACFPTAVLRGIGGGGDSLQQQQQEILVINQENITRFNVADGTWKVNPVSNGSNNNNDNRLVTNTIPYPGIGRRAAIDPTTDKIYIPGASLGMDGGLLLLDPTTGFTTGLSQPRETLDIKSYGFVYSTVRKSFLLVGGDRTGQAGLNNVTYEFVPGNTTWSVLTTTGDIPPPRLGHCMVPAYGGQQMVLYGGYSTKKLSDIYILDVQTLSWKQGIPGGAGNERNSHVCAVSGDIFIAWGGQAAASVVGVYNLKTNEWLGSYTPSPAAVPAVSSSSVPTGLVAGLSVGLVTVVILVIGFFFFKRRRSQRQLHLEKEGSLKKPSDTDEEGQEKRRSKVSSARSLAPQGWLSKEEHHHVISGKLSIPGGADAGEDNGTKDPHHHHISVAPSSSDKSRGEPRNPHTDGGEFSAPVAIPGPQSISES
ncbi:hypothetical protein DFQ27_005658 [Actinomortierella ambigua]|uniref:Galactose oxidase n=1 Tax=Actinomortierella ambigua TaxID=1343610 RepID=A0A9P6PZR6_9FUNG|nr:hypothetical protein DFQ27_005658 [Actinomortierella ambigua]